MNTYNVIFEGRGQRGPFTLEQARSVAAAYGVAYEIADAKTGVVIYDALCQSCVDRAWPSHAGSSRCESGSLASGGTHTHCTCDTCF